METTGLDLFLSSKSVPGTRVLPSIVNRALRLIITPSLYLQMKTHRQRLWTVLCLFGSSGLCLSGLNASSKVGRYKCPVSSSLIASIQRVLKGALVAEPKFIGVSPMDCIASML